MAQSFLVIGTGRFGSSVARELFDFGFEVVAVDQSEERLAEVMDHVTHAAVVDATDDRALAQLGVASFDIVIVAIGSDLEASILATVAAKSAGASYVISKANNRMTARILASIGADEVVRPEQDMGRRLAHQLAKPNEIATLQIGPDHSAAEFEARNRTGTIESLELDERFTVTIVAVHRGNLVETNPGPDYEVFKGDRILVIGRNEDLEAVREYLDD